MNFRHGCTRNILELGMHYIVPVRNSYVFYFKYGVFHRYSIRRIDFYLLVNKTCKSWEEANGDFINQINEIWNGKNPCYLDRNALFSCP